MTFVAYLHEEISLVSNSFLKKDMLEGFSTLPPEKIDQEHSIVPDQFDHSDTRKSVLDVLQESEFPDEASVKLFVERVSRLPEPLRRWGLHLLSVVMMLWLQGCTMYAPRYGEVFRRADRPLDILEMNQRQQRVNRFLTNPDDLTRTPALQTGIESFQRERILNNFYDLIRTVRSNDFDEYLRVCEAAKTNLGIMNPDRYDPDFLKAVLDNYNNPELLRERPVILAIVARKDRQSIGGIQALNAETYRLQEFSRVNKVLLVETDSINEIQHHVNSLSQRGILRLGNLQGIIIVGHGNTSDIDVGLNVGRDFIKISRLNWYLAKENPRSFIVFASCHSGDGAAGGFDGFSNFANRAALLFPSTQILACNGYMTGIEIQPDSSGRITDRSITMERASDLFSSGDSTYRPNIDQVRSQAFPVYRRAISQTIPDGYLRHALNSGLINSDDIIQTFNTGIDPFEFRIYLDCGLSYDEINRFRRNGIAAVRVFEYTQAGIWSRSLMMDLARNRITPERFLAQQVTGKE